MKTAEQIRKKIRRLQIDVNRTGSKVKQDRIKAQVDVLLWALYEDFKDLDLLIE